jgi:DNA-binding XRE family transcriptional regulator
MVAFKRRYAMSTAVELVNNVNELDPRDAAERIIDAHARESGWLDEFSEHLDRRRSGNTLTRVLAIWGLNQSDAACIFGVTRQAISKWIEQGLPAERIEPVADLEAATDLLVRYLKRERIPAVVRRASGKLGDASLLDLLKDGDTDTVLSACRSMFSFEQAHT